LLPQPELSDIPKWGYELAKDIWQNTHQIAQQWVDPKQHILVGSTTFKLQPKVSEALTKADKMLTEAHANN
jgi:hypothetical protein